MDAVNFVQGVGDTVNGCCEFCTGCWGCCEWML